ncbi:diisopropyl-fluorophosphatase-like isoform X1 [Styela clava]
MAVTIELKFKKICDGLDGSEGPVFNTKGDFYAVAPMPTLEDGRVEEASQFLDKIAGNLHKVNLDTGEHEVVCTPQFEGYGGRPAGCQSDKNGNIWIADMRLGILKYSPEDGKCQQLSKVDSSGNALNGCNDLVFDKDGNLWVTGPGSPIAPSAEDRTLIFQKPSGRLYFLENGNTIPVAMDETFRFCNGIAIRDNLLLVAETMTRSIIVFDVVSSGKLSNRRVWATLPKADYDNPMNVGGPDGMDFDVNGNLLVAHHGGGHLEVFSANGVLKTRIKCPFKQPSNLHFKPASRTCYVTEHDFNGVWEFEWECEGMPMYHFTSQ